MNLLIDQGNTTLSWCLMRSPGDLVPGGSIANERVVRYALESALARVDRPRIRGVFISSVADDARNAVLAEAIQAVLGLEPSFLKSSAVACGIRNGYLEPGRLGIDRWCAVIGARTIEPGDCVVVDLGSAVTIDVIRGHNHLGGYIVPGYYMQVRALAGGTARIGHHDEVGGLGFGITTAEAVHRGVLTALAAMVDRCWNEAAAGVAEKVALVLTGGDAARVSPLVVTEHRIVNDLLFRGMAALVSESST